MLIVIWKAGEGGAPLQSMPVTEVIYRRKTGALLVSTESALLAVELRVLLRPLLELLPASALLLGLLEPAPLLL